MLDIVHLLNDKMRANPMWRKLAESVEDLINTTVGSATDEALNAIGNPHKLLRGDRVDPRSYADILAVAGDGGLSHAALLEERERDARVRVVLPIDDKGNAQVYMDIDGVTYMAAERQYHSRDILVQETRNLGFDFFSDDLSDADYARVMLFISEYWPRSGSHEALAAFLGFIRNIRIDMVRLWTVDDDLEDYEILARFDSNMTPVWEGGKYYPTFHYDLYYDAFADTDVNELRRLFFAMAPIHLVLRRMVETIRSTAIGYASAGPLLTAPKALIWDAQRGGRPSYRRMRFVASTINKPVPLVTSSTETPNGIAIAAMGAGGIWIVERDPYVAAPDDPVQYMLDHGFYISPSVDANDRFNFPAHGLWRNVWGMATIANTACVVETF